MNGEPVTIVADDGVVLRGELFVPVGPTYTAIVLSHAMMVDRRTLDRPRGGGLLSALCRGGVAVLWLDLRGHGQSDPPNGARGDWTYDDLVEDVGAVAVFLAGRFPHAELVAVGHSLFGHVALAYQARLSGAADERAGFDRLVLIGSSVWARPYEVNRLRRSGKVAVMAGLSAMARVCGRFPTRRLRLGTADESVGFVDQMRTWMSGDWCDLAGRSYRLSLDRVRVPVLSIAGAGDRLSSPDNQRRFVSFIGSEVRHRLIGRSTGFPLDPGHMDLVLDSRLAEVWDDIADFACGTPMS